MVEFLCVIVRIKEWRWVRSSFRSCLLCVTQTMIRACARPSAGSKSGVSSTIVVAQLSTRSIKPISTVLLYQSASLLPFCCNEQEFYREFLLARLKNFVPAFRGGKSFHFFFSLFKGNLIDTLDVCCFYGLWNWDLFFFPFFFFFFFVECEIIQIGINRWL